MHPTLRNALLAFFIAAAIFGTGFWASSTINTLRISELREIEQRIAIDTLSLETQFDLLGNLACAELSENSVLSSELNNLAEKLDFTESRLGSDNEEVVLLKKQYSLLQIKDYLLMRQVSEKCNLKPVFVLYFYSNVAGDCENCDSAGHVLTYLRETYPQLRVYSFDYNLDLGALETLIAINKIDPIFPAFVVQGKTYYNLSDQESIMSTLPESMLLTATSTEATN
jgi:hypothetical protein